MENTGTNVIFVIALVFAVAAILTVIAAFVAAWWDNNPRVTVRRGSKESILTANSRILRAEHLLAFFSRRFSALYD